LLIEAGATMSPLDQVQAIKSILNKQRSISQVSEAAKQSKMAVVKENKRLYENIVNIKTQPQFSYLGLPNYSKTAVQRTFEAGLPIQKLEKVK
jgi:hypothetical protein